MTASTNFKKTIEEYLIVRASDDPLFAFKFRKENKNIDDCITYILNYVQKSGCSGFTDQEIFSQAIHYYDEDNLEIGNPIDCQIVVNHTIELTAEEKSQAREIAIQRAADKMISSPKKNSKPQKFTSELTLF